jgi:hypothetical protein
MKRYRAHLICLTREFCNTAIAVRAALQSPSSIILLLPAGPIMRTFRNKIGADNSRKCLLTRERLFNETGPRLPLKPVARTFTNEHISYNTSSLRSFKVEAVLTILAADMGEMSNSQFSDLHRTELVCGIRLSFDNTDQIYCNCCLSKQ